MNPDRRTRWSSITRIKRSRETRYSDNFFLKLGWFDKKGEQGTWKITVVTVLTVDLPTKANLPVADGVFHFSLSSHFSPIRPAAVCPAPMRPVGRVLAEWIESRRCAADRPIPGALA
jgi:hypothetical protein